MSATTPTPPQAPGRTYRAYSQPWWRRVLLTREFAVITLLVAVFVYSNENVPELRRPADARTTCSSTPRRSCSSRCR